MGVAMKKRRREFAGQKAGQISVGQCNVFQVPGERDHRGLHAAAQRQDNGGGAIEGREQLRRGGPWIR
jgi:hypothetical protein